MTYREVFKAADLIGKNAIYHALKIARGEASTPDEVRPKLTAQCGGWAAITKMESK